MGRISEEGSPGLDAAAAPGAVQGGAMIHMGHCYRENLCVDCDSEDCIFAGNIEADCPALKCLNPDKECKDCEFLKEYVAKWREVKDDGDT